MTMSRKTLSIGGATYDLFVRAGKGALRTDATGRMLNLPLGEKIRVQQVIETCGGGAANTSVGLARLGCSAFFCGIIGSDQWGERLLAAFQAEHVDTRCATIVEGETTSFSIILSANSGERVILYDPGTNAHLHDANFDRESVAEMDWIYLNHIHERSCVIENDIMAMLRQKPSMGMTWNPGGSQLKDGIGDKGNRMLLAETDLLILNMEEALAFTGRSNAEDAVAALLDGGAVAVCICDGRRGTIGATGRERWHCSVWNEAPVVDTTGAGDAFGSGATWARLHGLDLPQILRAGTINATGVIGAIGAQAGLLTDTEMKRRLHEIHLDVTERIP